MATTGSLVEGTVQGVAGGLGASVGEIIGVVGNPSGIMTGVPTSGVAFDTTNGAFYMYLTDTTWINLGSVE
tara:strand:+ start:4191 stop:4403 length:213 start_codon:yes stop_codon:yes gene_type:complete